MAIAKPKGTYDILPNDAWKWNRFEKLVRNVCRLYNFKEIRTPIFESSDLFHRTVGETSDMVTKETYDFLDRGGRSITLSPEGTAGVARSYIENKMYAGGNVQKLFYMGPIFRYERPQKGRTRQFSQFGVEALGSSSPLMDVEVIAFSVTTLKALGLKGIKVRINSIGDEESRDRYREALVEYFSQYEAELCGDCKNRLVKNPLRILDCKVDNNKEFFKNAPKISDYLNDVSKNHFNQVLEALGEMGIQYEINPNLVRGLDYYCHTVFELEADIEGFGAQNVVGGGGRYDKLIGDLGGPQTPCVGMAFGVDRLLIAMESEGLLNNNNEYIHLYLIGLGDKARVVGERLLYTMRLGGLICDADYLNKGLKGQFKQADRMNAKFTAILGDTELENFVINVKNNETDEQVTIPLHDLYTHVISSIQAKTQSPCATCKDKKEE
jgi:histidyl-tRNA synthetase